MLKQTNINNMHSGKVNKIWYDNPGKPMKQTRFNVKNLGGNIFEKQFTIVKRSFRSSKNLFPRLYNPRRWTYSRNLLPLQNLWTLQYMNATLLHGSQYVINSSNLKMLLATKFFTSSTMNIKKYLVIEL